MEQSYYIAAIDLGSSKIVGALAKKTGDKIEVIKLEEEPTENKCVAKGMLNPSCIDDVAFQISRILKRLSTNAPVKAINYCYVLWKGMLKDVTSAEKLASKLKKTELLFPSVSSMQLLADKFATPEEKEIGCMLIDFGHTATSYTYIDGGTVKQEGLIPGGSNHISTDLMAIFNYGQALADRLKMTFARAIPLEEADKLIDLGGGKQIRISELTSKISDRINEIFSYTLSYMGKNQWHSNRSRTIIVSGGGANLQQIEKYLLKRTGLTARCTKLKDDDILGEFTDRLQKFEYASLVALLAFATRPCDEKKQGMFDRMNSIIKRSTAKTVELFDTSDNESEKFPTKKQ
ncbi:MAG: hypothetical protein MJ003_04635 [Paludibacteraceae bacterium]|nr:hypothetical protein [Paludibacteraceae bacterium]